MDSAAYLQRQGWRGDGHSLDLTGKGIKKPLLVSKKVDSLGVGLNKHAAVSDQWWLKAFDQGLKDLGTGKQSVLASVQKHGHNLGGLYGRFVKGEGVPGTFAESLTSSGTQTPVVAEEKAKSPDVQVVAKDSKKRKRGESSEQKQAKRKVETADDGAAAHNEEQEGAINAKIKTLVREAVRRGIIPPDGKEAKMGLADGGSLVRARAELDAFLAATSFTVPANAKPLESKQDRMKVRRQLRRAIREYLGGESPKKKAEKVKKGDDKEEREKKKKERKAERAALKARVNERLREQEGGALVVKAKDASADGFKDGTDEIKLDLNTSGRLKTIPGVGVVDRYPTQAEKKRKKKEKKAEAEALEQAKRDEEAAKVTKEERKKKKEKKAPVEETSENSSSESDASSSSESEESEDEVETQERAPEATEEAGFVVDTTGDVSLTVPTAREFSQRAIAAISDNQSITMKDQQGKLFRWTSDSPIPMDPRIWSGIEAKEIKFMLPRPIREVRRKYMALQRVAKKQARDPNAVTEEKNARGQLKTEKREAFKTKLLKMSREAIKEGRELGTVEIDGVQVPLIKVHSMSGEFKKDEIALARTTARRVLRNAKREEKAAKGRGKGWKKRGRSGGQQ
jgi:hypothetical protein